MCALFAATKHRPQIRQATLYFRSTIFLSSCIPQVLTHPHARANTQALIYNKHSTHAQYARRIYMQPHTHTLYHALALALAPTITHLHSHFTQANILWPFVQQILLKPWSNFRLMTNPNRLLPPALSLAPPPKKPRTFRVPLW